MSLERVTRSAALRTALLLLLGAFTGALLFFAGTAGTVLRESPSRHAGGAVNRALLDVLDLSSYAAAALAFLLVLLLDRVEPLPKVQKGLALRLLVVVAAAAFASHEVITPQMMALRDRLPTLVELLPGADPARKEWGRLHAFSAAVLLVRLLASTALFVLLSRKPRRTIAVTANAAAEGPTAA
ncbi:MAG: DUF4149 domain-containing protein [Holophagales bacterium]|jgi:hypothetical protein|nr:DUF4149 domain-containing protein [Holophagales bacterium]